MGYFVSQFPATPFTNPPEPSFDDESLSQKVKRMDEQQKKLEIPEILEEFVKVRNQFDKAEDLPPPGIYPAEFLVMLPGPTMWSDNKCCYFYFLLKYEGKEFCPGFLATTKSQAHVLSSHLYTLLSGNEPPEYIPDLSKYRGKKLKVGIIRAIAAKAKKYYPKIVAIHPVGTVKKK